MSPLTPTEEHTFDVVVVGGGLSGLCAALAAARNGAVTAIVQDRPVFGGNSSSEVRVVPYGASHGAAWGSETGIVHDLLLQDRARNHEDFFDHGMMNSVYDLGLSEAVRQQPGLTAFLNTSVRAVEVEELPAESGYERRVTAVHASQLATEKELLLRARQVVDATGDGTVGALAGAESRYGREARAEFAEPLAPRTADTETLGATITMRARRIDRPAPYDPPGWIAAYRTPDDFVLDRRLYHIEKDTFGGYWWLEVNSPFHQIADTAEVREELHRHVLGVWNYLKNHSPEKERFAGYVLDWIGQIPGKRESRRLVGDVLLTEHDVHTDRQWPDGIGYASWWIDLHINGGINNREAPGERENIDTRYSDYVRLAPFSLPLRACYSANVENLWLAGRCLSVSHVAIGPVRVQLTLGALGQAVGTAAAWAHEHQLTPRQTADPDGQHIAGLRQRLLRQDVRLLGLRSTDPDDHARRARVSASSAAGLDWPDPATADAADVRWWPLDTDRAQVLPLTSDRLQGVSLYLHNGSDHEVAVAVDLEQLGRIWDREHGKPVASGAAVLPAGHQGWVDVALDAAVEPDTPHRLVLRAAEGVRWAGATGSGPGPIGTVGSYLTRSPGGCEPKNAELACFSLDEVDLPAYELWRQQRKGPHAIRTSPEQRPYEARYAVDGAAWPEDLPHLWLSEPVRPGEPQWLLLEWDEPVDVGRVQVSFETELDARTDQRKGLSSPRHCARSWRLQARVDGRLQLLHTETGNVRRQRVVELARPVRAEAVRLEVEEVGTPGAGVGVCELRVHAPE